MCKTSNYKYYITEAKLVQMGQSYDKLTSGLNQELRAKDYFPVFVIHKARTPSVWNFHLILCCSGIQYSVMEKGYKKIQCFNIACISK